MSLLGGLICMFFGWIIPGAKEGSVGCKVIIGIVVALLLIARLAGA